MASFNPLTKELVFKIVFSGCGLGGKTTTLERLYEAAPVERRGQLVSLATASDRTLYFDFLPLRGERVRGLGVRLQLFTVPGQVHYAATRKLVLTGADGIVFVADAQAARLDANLESLEDLEKNLAELGRSLATMPHVMQWNKGDLPATMSPTALDGSLNRHGAPAHSTVAATGEGVAAVLESITKVAVAAYLSTLPDAADQAEEVRDTTQRIKFAPEGVGLAAAVRDWTEGRTLETSLPERASLTPRTGRRSEARAGSLGPPKSGNGPTSSDRFSLAELFPGADRVDARGAEDLLLRGDTAGAVLASEALSAKSLALIGEERGAAWLLAGLPADGYRTFRALVAAAHAHTPISRDAALRCLLWAAMAAVAARPDTSHLVGGGH